MKQLKIEYPHLKHIKFEDRYKEIDVPDELIELLKDLIPYYMSIYTSHKIYTEESRETELLSARNKEIKDKIFSFDIEVELVFIINGISMIVKIYHDKELERMSLDIFPTKIIRFDYEWSII